MHVQYLFNSDGEWIAFRHGQGVFDERCNWIGWLPWGNHEVANQEGEYLGTIVDVNRFYYFVDRPRRPNPGYPERPTYPALPDSPGLAARAVLPVGATDVARLEKSRDRSSGSAAGNVVTA
jgi:hypothetical protein